MFPIVWEELLRKGIRGGSVREIIGILSRNGHKPTVLSPSQGDLTDRIDMWYAQTKKSRFVGANRVFYWLSKLVKMTTGMVCLPVLSLAIEKSKPVE